MSKIIEALEKARQDGILEQTVGTVRERDTLAPVGAEAAAPARRVRRRRHGPAVGLMSAQGLDPAVTRGVDPHVETLHKPMSVVSEQYRALRGRIERLDFEGRLTTIAVTSAFKGEGKSVTAANLAVVLAQDATKRILLVDADLRRPKVHVLLDLEPSPGLGDFLGGTAGAEELVRVTPFFGLHVVTAGHVQGHPSELLASPELAETVARWRVEYDHVVFDTPPLHPISDVNFLSGSIDGVIVVARNGKTAKGALEEAAASLPPGKLIGTVLNRAETMQRRYAYGKGGNYYYKYY